MILAVALLAVLCCVNAQQMCGPTRLETVLQHLGATLIPGSTDPQVQDSSLHIWYDYDKKRMRIESNQLNEHTGMRNIVTVLQYYEHDMQYISSGGGCSHTSLRNATMEPPCFPASFVRGRDVTIGTGSQMLKAMEYSGMEDKLMVSYLVSASGVPLIRSIQGTDSNNNQVLNSYVYGNYTVGVSDLMFNLPYECIGAQPVIGRRDLEVIEDVQRKAQLHPYINIYED